MSYINGCSCSYGYAINNDLTSLAHTFVGSSVSFVFGYNKVHQVTRFSSDDAAYMWPAPTTFGINTYGMANSLNQYPSVNSTEYGYDQNGNLTSGLNAAAFDALNRITQVTKSGVTNNYWNDPLSRQAQKEFNAEKKQYLYDGPQTIAEYEDSDISRRFIPTAPLGAICVQVDATTVSFLHQDRLNSTVARTNAEGAVENVYKYSTFGETAELAGTSFGFTGQRYDSEVGLYNYKARYYSPNISRFIQPDPLGYSAGDMNLYAYVHNDAINLLDFFGLEPGHSGGGNTGGNGDGGGYSSGTGGTGTDTGSGGTSGTGFGGNSGNGTGYERRGRTGDYPSGAPNGADVGHMKNPFDMDMPPGVTSTLGEGVEESAKSNRILYDNQTGKRYFLNESGDIIRISKNIDYINLDAGGFVSSGKMNPTVRFPQLNNLPIPIPLIPPLR